MMRLLDWVLNATIAVVMLLIIFVAGPEVETRWFPAYSKFTIDDVKPTPDGEGSVVTVEFSVFRRCVPQGYAWYTGDLGLGMRLVNVKSRALPPTMRPVGRHRSVIDVDISPAEIMNNLYAEVFSRCHPFWVTRSVIYP